jgi:arsenical pump membrane protein
VGICQICYNRGMSIALLFIALISLIFFAIRPIKIGGIVLNMVTVPLAVIFVLFVWGVIDYSTLLSGFFGSGSIVPWEILLLFFSVAYVSISADASGIFDWVAAKAISVVGGSGWKLFFFVFLFSSILTILTSNDIVILTLTPIIFYLSRYAKINVIPLLFAQFYAANTASMFFLIGNPTNIIVSNAFGFSFWEYVQVMGLPTIVALFVLAALLVILFGHQVTHRFELKRSIHFFLPSRTNALISSVLLVGMLISLSVAHLASLPLWFITLLFATLMLGKDLFRQYAHDIIEKRHKRNYFQRWFEKEYGSARVIVRRMPTQLFFFIAAMFILVSGLNEVGIVDFFAKRLVQFSIDLPTTILSMGVLSAFLANIINNQPMTIFLSHVLTSESFQRIPVLWQKGSAFALVIGSNLGANLTLLGALAGLLWKDILKEKGIIISYKDFLLKGLVIVPITLCASLLTLIFVLS